MPCRRLQRSSRFGLITCTVYNACDDPYVTACGIARTYKARRCAEWMCWGRKPDGARPTTTTTATTTMSVPPSTPTTGSTIVANHDSPDVVVPIYGSALIAFFGVVLLAAALLGGYKLRLRMRSRNRPQSDLSSDFDSNDDRPDLDVTYNVANGTIRFNLFGTDADSSSASTHEKEVRVEMSSERDLPEELDSQTEMDANVIASLTGQMVDTITKKGDNGERDIDVEMITGTRPKKPVVAQPGTERNDDVEADQPNNEMSVVVEVHEPEEPSVKDMEESMEAMALALVMSLRDQGEIPPDLPTPVSTGVPNTQEWSYSTLETSQWWRADTRDRSRWLSPRPLNLRQYNTARPVRSTEDLRVLEAEGTRTLADEFKEAEEHGRKMAEKNGYRTLRPRK